MPRADIQNKQPQSNFVFASSLPSNITKPFLLETIEKTLEVIDWVPQGMISVAFVSKQKSREINNEFAGNDYPTDVLSFDYPVQKNSEGSQLSEEFAGEIIVCSQIAVAQASEYNVDIRSEVALLLVHGILHLSGLDHQDNAQKASFETLQSVILKSLNLKYHTMPW